MAIKIMTDSTSDMDRAAAQAMGVEVMPLRVFFQQESYRDGVDISKDEFYSKLAQAKTLPTTSQVNPDEFVTVFQKHLNEGDQVLGIFLSSKISGTYQSAVIAKEMLETDQILVVDSLTSTVGLGLLVRRAVEMRDQGDSIQAIQSEMERMAQKVILLAIVGSLKYLKMGGRISASTALVGGVLGISPIVALEKGEITSIGKVKGLKAGFKFVKDYLEARPPEPGQMAAFAHSANGEVVVDFEKFIMEQGLFQTSFCDELGAVIGTHGGPGCYGLAYIIK